MVVYCAIHGSIITAYYAVHGDRIMVDRLYLFTIFNALVKGKSHYVKKPIPEITLEGI